MEINPMANTFVITREILAIIFNVSPENADLSKLMMAKLLVAFREKTAKITKSAFNGLPSEMAQKFAKILTDNKIELSAIMTGRTVGEGGNAQVFADISDEMAEMVQEVISSVKALNSALDVHNKAEGTTFWFQSAFMTHPRNKKN
jgi:hypothetical protein